ncbi:MAG: hypothetical protein K2N74_00025, partial [Clostridiales bacterium]|nr:hypothetical protein [Clostridiales bacterium]
EENITYFACFKNQLTVSYNFNLWKYNYYGQAIEPVEHTGAVSKTDCNSGDQVTVKDSAYEVEGYEFLCWSTVPDGPIAYIDNEKLEGQYYPGDEITMGEESITLYAQWRQRFLPVDSSIDYEIHAALHIKGQGSAVLVKKDGTKVVGEINVTPANDYEFTVVDGSETIIGKVNYAEEYGAKFELRNSANVGYYQYYDWVNDEAGGADFYVSGYETRDTANDGTPYTYQTAALHYNNKDYVGALSIINGECTFVGFDNPYKVPDLNGMLYINLKFLEFAVGTEHTVEGVPVRSYYMLRGEESMYKMENEQEGKWIYFDGENYGADEWLYTLSLELDGFGKATVYEVVTDDEGKNPTFNVYATGTYAKNGDYYSSILGEWKFIPDAGSTIEAFLFKMG